MGNQRIRWDFILHKGSPATSASAIFSSTVASYAALLNWTASTSTGVTGYNVYRSTVSGSSYAKINLSLVAGATLTQTPPYYYVTTAVDARGDESIYSNDVQAVIP
jgi:hypothetical protein